ncbi:MAG: hypothetical protein P9E24_08180 [Candidatus Competibacter sp.]|nr:hypothetical protein [Candidatus Competibacter sp.]MDG4583164.1 hypothetical protein [Candidatus Competibacter sp.]
MRPRKPPKPAIRRTIWLKGGGASGGLARYATIQAACHSSGSNTTSHDGFGQSRPQVTKCKMRRQGHRVAIQGLAHPSRRPVRGGRQGECHLAQRLAPGQPLFTGVAASMTPEQARALVDKPPAALLESQRGES